MLGNSAHNERGRLHQFNPGKMAPSSPSANRFLWAIAATMQHPTATANPTGDRASTAEPVCPEQLCLESSYTEPPRANYRHQGATSALRVPKASAPSFFPTSNY
ncbi:hypothetical protein ACQ4M4_26320 [Leptolyngbya sp. AN02str]|uniref:hypothetical protein n=1 Tax=Leptolyngbya sp. AN02str TaxID=3423363 RepID=UPI003D322934